ncbi:hypothetical protein ACH5RR_027408 [Cinchona calisaya]|uniref:Uncharacterized protein n=1 Tax=Cinchona calisaya TaxID=153742 RepID=A0ABD2Z782_9GENT
MVKILDLKKGLVSKGIIMGGKKKKAKGITMPNILHDRNSASSRPNAFIPQTWNQHQLYGLQSRLQLLNIPPNNLDLLLKSQTLISQVGSMCGQSQTFFGDSSKNHTNNSDLFCYTREPSKDEDTRTLIVIFLNLILIFSYF